jgi:hypothetical protein
MQRKRKGPKPADLKVKKGEGEADVAAAPPQTVNGEKLESFVIAVNLIAVVLVLTREIYSGDWLPGLFNGTLFSRDPEMWSL